MHDRLTIVRPAALGDALAGAIRDILDRPLHIDESHARLLDARLAAGDFESVRTLLRTAPAVPALPLLLARYVRWSGDLHTATAVWSTALAALEPLLDDDADPAHSWLRRATARELGATATDLGDAGLAARLHRVAREDATADPPEHDDTPDAALETVAHAASGILGIEPDASRGRLRLRPALDRVESLEAHGIRFADATVSLRADATRDAVTIRVAQDSGSIPVTLLLEPFLDGAGAVTVDGQPAELTPGTIDGRTVLPVQLVLDDERTLVAQRTGGR